MGKKRIKLAALFIAAIMSVGTMSAYAENTVSCSVNGSSYSITGTAKADSISVIIMPAEEKVEDLSLEKLNSKGFISFSVVNSGGDYEKSFNLPADFAQGEYKSVIYDGAEYTEKYFIFGSDEFKKETISSKIKNGTLSEFIKRYGQEYGIDFDVYNSQKDSVKEKISTKLSEIVIADLKTQYDKIIKESIFEALETTSELKALLTLNGADFTEFNKLTSNQQTLVLTTTLNNLPDSVVNLNGVFDKYIEEFNDNPPSGGSGGSGGGGGGGGGGASSSSTVKGPTAGTTLIEDNPMPGTVIEPNKSDDADKPVVILPDTVNHWARGYITELNSLGIITGYEDGNFYPEKNITRAEFAKLITSATGLAVENTTEAEFSDVAQNSWYAPYVYALSKNGYITGYDNGTFCPDKLITREDSSVIIYRVLVNMGYAMETDAQFGDMANASDYAKDAIAKLGGVGILTGSDGNVIPKSNLTRAQAAAMISRLLGNITERGM